MSSIIERLIDQEPSLTLSEQLDVVVIVADTLLDALERVESELIDVEMEIPIYITNAIALAKGEQQQ